MTNQPFPKNTRVQYVLTDSDEVEFGVVRRHAGDQYWIVPDDGGCGLFLPMANVQRLELGLVELADNLRYARERLRELKFLARQARVSRIGTFEPVPPFGPLTKRMPPDAS